MKKSNSPLSPDVLIVGAGVAGSVLASLLERRGLSVILAECAEAPRKIFKGEYLQPAAVKILRDAGFGSLLRSRSTVTMRELRFRDLDGAGRVVSDILMKYPRGHSARAISHHDLLRGLFSANRRRLGKRFWAGCNVIPANRDSPGFLNEPEFRLEAGGRGPATVRPRWVVGCDGRTSTVRKWMKLAEPGDSEQNVTIGAGREFIMGMEIRDQAPKRDRYEIIRPAGRGTLSAFSLGPHGQRIYYSMPAGEHLAKNAAREIRDILAGVKKMAPIGSAPDHALASGSLAHTTAFHGCAAGRFLLVGDAVALTTPYGGQGMTLASQQASYLAAEFSWEEESLFALARAKRDYVRFVRGGYERVNLLNFGLYNLFFARDAIYKQLTRHVLQHWRKNPECAARVMRLFAGLDRDKPGVTELMELWGVTQLKPMLSTATAILGELAGNLWQERGKAV